MGFSKPSSTARGARRQPARQAVTLTTRHAVNRQTGAVPEFQARRIARRLDDLERTNSHDIPISAFHHSTPSDLLQASLDVPPSAEAGPGPSTSKSRGGGPAKMGKTVVPPPGLLEDDKTKKRKPRTANVKRLLIYKKSLREYIEEMKETPSYVTASTKPPTYPPRKLCSACGYLGAYACNKCGEWSCSRKCVETHESSAGCGVGG